MNSLLKITRMTDEKTSSDGRKYRTVYFQKQPQQDGVLSNAPERGVNIWEEGPNGSAGDAIYDSLAVGAKVLGDVQSIEVEEYFIPSEYGKFNHPKTGQPANKATTFSSVVFEGENIAQKARSQGHTLAGEAEAKALEEQEEIQEEVAV